jgi:hypothetical protein
VPNVVRIARPATARPTAADLAEEKIPLGDTGTYGTF